MNTQDNKNLEPEIAILDNESWAGSESLDSDHEWAEWEKTPISTDDFEPKSEEPETEKKSTTANANKTNIEDKMFEKYVIQEDWSFDFDNLPEDLKWTTKGIRERYLQPEEKPENDIDSLVNQWVTSELAERDFKNQLQDLVNDTETTPEQKTAIKDKYLELRAKWISSKTEAFAIAKQIAWVNVQPKKIVWVFPKQWIVPQSTIKTISPDALSGLSPAEYNATMEKVDNWELNIA